VEPQPDTSAHVFDAEPAQIGDVAGAEGLWIHELTLVQSSLEEAFMRLTAGSVEYHAGRTDAQRALSTEQASGWGWGEAQGGQPGQNSRDAQPTQNSQAVQSTQNSRDTQPTQNSQAVQPDQNSQAKERIL
jgi:ABC-2 type transport system ATP-binding protein